MMPKRREGEEKADAKPARGLPLFDPEKLSAKMAGASGRDWRVLLHLATFADWGNGAGARPASSTLAADLGLDESNVRKTLRRLAARGAVVEVSPATPRRPAVWSFAPVVRPSRAGAAPPSGLGGSFPGGLKRGDGSGRSVRCGTCRDTGKVVVGFDANRKQQFGPCSCTKRGGR